MGDIIEIIKNTATTFVDGVEILIDSMSLVFSLFPSSIATLLLWGVGFLLVTMLVMFALRVKG